MPILFGRYPRSHLSFMCLRMNLSRFFSTCFPSSWILWSGGYISFSLTYGSLLVCIWLILVIFHSAYLIFLLLIFYFLWSLLGTISVFWRVFHWLRVGGTFREQWNALQACMLLYLFSVTQFFYLLLSALLLQLFFHF